MSLPLSFPCPPTPPEIPLTSPPPPSNQRRTHLGILLRRRRPRRIHVFKGKILPPSLHSVDGEGKEESGGEGGAGEYHEFFREEVADPPGEGRGRGEEGGVCWMDEYGAGTEGDGSGREGSDWGVRGST